MLFSVLIANYNNFDFLKECIDSVLNQIYSKWEIVFVDDCSTDDSIKLINDYAKKDNRIKIFENDNNYGVGYTKKRCIELANGEICGFLDPDDTITTDALEIMVNGHIANPEHSIIYSTHYVCDKQLVVQKISETPKTIPQNENHLTFSGISHFATFKKAYYNKTIGLNPNLKKAIDQDLYYKLEEVGPVKFIEKPLYYYRIHERGIASMGGNELDAFYWKLLVQKDAYKRRKKNKKNIKNISIHKLNKNFLSYYLSKANIEKKRKNSKRKKIYLFRALRYFIYDKNLLILRLFLK